MRSNDHYIQQKKFKGKRHHFFQWGFLKWIFEKYWFWFLLCYWKFSNFQVWISVEKNSCLFLYFRAKLSAVEPCENGLWLPGNSCAYSSLYYGTAGSCYIPGSFIDGSGTVDSWFCCCCFFGFIYIRELFNLFD